MSTSVPSPKVKRISPMLAVADLEQTLEFYATVLGFEVVMKSPAYAIIGKDGATIHFMKATDKTILEAVRGHTDIYIEVEDIATLWRQVKHFQGKYRIRELFEQPYGMLEFHIGDPNGCLIFVGQRIG